MITDCFLRFSPVNKSLQKLLGAASISLSIKANEVNGVTHLNLDRGVRHPDPL